MSKTILLADDSVTIQKVVELTFMGQDYQVTAVSDGGAALAMLSDTQPDIVIADVHMPGPNGYELARHAKQQYPGLPVLLLVGTFEPFDEQEMLDCGAESHLKKPFDSQDLMREVERLVEATAAASSDQEDTQPLQPPLEEVEGSTEAEGFATSSPPLETGSAFDGFPPAPPLDDDEDLPALTLEEVEIQPEMVSFETDDESSPAAVGSETSEIETESFFTEEVTVPPTQEAPPAPAWGETPPAEPPSFSVPPVAAAAEDEPTEDAPTEDAPTEAAQETPAAASSSADTSEEVAASAAPGDDNGSASLSDADVDRIARRVVELMGESSVREVAWEIIPDLAEVIIRERIRELESQVE